MKIIIEDTNLLRCDDFQAAIIPEEHYVGQASGHLFNPGDKVILTGLEQFPEYNGQEVTITNIRKDGSFGRAYYVKGSINRYVNWVYEYRLQKGPKE